MRSRDGNSSLTRTIRTIVVLFLVSLVYSSSLLALDNTKEFLISYRYVVRDTMLYNDSLQITNTMTKCNGDPQSPLLLDIYKNSNLKSIIIENSEIFIDYIHKLGLHVEHVGKTINYQHSSITILTLKTTCFKVDFNEKFVRIAPLK